MPVGTIHSEHINTEFQSAHFTRIIFLLIGEKKPNDFKLSKNTK